MGKLSNQMWIYHDFSSQPCLSEEGITWKNTVCLNWMYYDVLNRIISIVKLTVGPGKDLFWLPLASARFYQPVSFVEPSGCVGKYDTLKKKHMVLNFVLSCFIY